VGQNVPFTLSGLPADGSVIATNFQWTFDGKYFNSQSNAVPYASFPTCSKVPYVDASLLTSNTTTAWWVSGGFNPSKTYMATQQCDLILTNGSPKQTVRTKGLFTMFRPQARIASTTGTVSVNSTWGLLALAFGTTNVPGIVFSNNMTMPPANSPWVNATNVHWAQVVNSIRATQQRASDMAYPHAYESGLDHVFPYDNVPNNNNIAFDAPSIGLSDDYLECNMLTDTFTMWLLFKYDETTNTHYVPLRAVDWYWAASATNGPSGWVIESGTATNSINPVDYETLNYPYWTTAITNNTIQFTYP